MSRPYEMKQHTIKEPVSLTGIGLHTGQQATLTFNPAPEDHGFKFQRVDLENQPVLSADINRVISTDRGTTIQVNDATVSTVEHVLSALCGLQIDNVLIMIDGPEAPILDGSAAEYVKALKAAGIQEQNADRQFFEIEEPIAYRDEKTGAELIALPADHFEVTTMIDFYGLAGKGFPGW
ncbi:MAG TPA: UDP-3-O-acyl-N-acetylglucosamine deacetylase, partial [Flavilitoribacter sp.]|nr:UDP-3-O-acyl-N-acetylglucosamine deacetylase [Flavilitoribacter sp.]